MKCATEARHVRMKHDHPVPRATMFTLCPSNTKRLNNFCPDFLANSRPQSITVRVDSQCVGVRALFDEHAMAWDEGCVSHHDILGCNYE